MSNFQVTREELSHLQQLVRDLVQGDANLPSSKLDSEGFDQTPYIVKQIFQAKREDAFSEQLSHFVFRKEGEIEKVCGLHYQEFVQSIDQLLKIQEETSSMKMKISSMNETMQHTAIKVIDKVWWI